MTTLHASNWFDSLNANDNGEAGDPRYEFSSTNNENAFLRLVKTPWLLSRRSFRVLFVVRTRRFFNIACEEIWMEVPNYGDDERNTNLHRYTNTNTHTHVQTKTERTWFENSCRRECGAVVSLAAPPHHHHLLHRGSGIVRVSKNLRKNEEAEEKKTSILGVRVCVYSAASCG